MRDRRKDKETREEHRETENISLDDLIMPIFIKEGISGKKEVASMPGIYQFSSHEAASEARRIYESGIPSVILFGIPESKDHAGSSAYDPDGIIQRTIRLVKEKAPSLGVIADVCMCEYTSHGHCGILKGQDVDNDATIEVLARIALSYAEAGADCVAPSAMMDGQVGAIKKNLMANGFDKVKIMAYSAKYVSSFYGPFRNAAESSPAFGDRKTYQMDYHNSDEAVEEARLDIAEGADIIMVKPAMGYQDIIYKIKKETNFPLAAYSVSGEYSMIASAASKGYLDERGAVLESLTGLKRAGADFIITYHALKAAEWVNKK